MKRLIVGLLAMSMVLVFTTAAISANGGETWEVLAKASPDECFLGIGEDNVYPFDPATEECSGQLKTNEAYVWGLTKYGENIFFGTGQNILALVLQGYLGITDPLLTDDYVIEGMDYQASPPFKDFRPSGLYLYNKTDGLVRLNSSIDEDAVALLNVTLGIRSAGSYEGVAFLAGPSLNSQNVNMFAFDAETGAFLGATALEGYGNVRKWLVGSDGELYVGMKENDGVGGVVLRWTGAKSTDPETLFAFETVAVGLDGDAAELVEHDGRIFVNTWPGNQNPAGLWMSPLMGIISADTSDAWVKLWSTTDYDPDTTTAYTYGGGAVESFDGWLYWGTMHVPGVAAMNHPAPGSTQEEVAQKIVGTWRAVSIFRGRNFGIDDVRPEIELLYGGSTLPFVPRGYFNAYVDGSWQTVPNKMGLTPLYGRGGFGNPFNNYTWAMRVFDDSLYIGTMDHSYLIFGLLHPLLVDLTASLENSVENYVEGQLEEITPALLNTIYQIQAFLDIQIGQALEFWDYLEQNNPGLHDNLELKINELLVYLEAQNPEEHLAEIRAKLTEIRDMVAAIPSDIHNAIATGATANFGADLWRFDDSSTPPEAVSLNGMGNSMNYGIRNMIADEDSLYIGTANPMNLSPDGGWELIELWKQVPGSGGPCFITTAATYNSLLFVMLLLGSGLICLAWFASARRKFNKR
jgi:hypothetical protein